MTIIPGRFWLERLIREMIWVSAYDRDVATVSNLILQIRFDKALFVIASELEALLSHRLRAEWGERREFSMLLEQLQLATALGKLLHISIT